MILRHAPLVLLVAVCSACSSMYYGMMESFGVEKREILVDRVEEGRDDQQEAVEQFQTTLEAFKDVTGFEGGDLEAVYARLRGELDDCEARAADVRGRIESIASVATALFGEWESELDQYTSAELRSQSETMLRDTRRRYDQLMAAMTRAESKMEPVLSAFREQVLFLKHNLNAQAIASLESNVVRIESDIGLLVADMEESIAEADAFIAALG